MLIRISLFVAIVAGLAVAGLNFALVNNKVTTLQTDLSNTKTQLADTQTRLSKTTSELNTTKTDLAQTKKTLDTTTTERDKAVKEADAQTKRANQLSDQLAKTTKERDDAQAELAAYKVPGLTPAQVASLAKTLRQTQDELTGVQDENKLLGQKLKETQTELAVYKTPGFQVPLPATLHGKILVADPKWNFVVVSVGKDQGALPYGELLVNRDGKLVAKVRISSVQKDRSIANVEPGWELGEPMEGDQVIPANPES